MRQHEREVLGQIPQPDQIKYLPVSILTVHYSNTLLSLILIKMAAYSTIKCIYLKVAYVLVAVLNLITS